MSIREHRRKRAAEIGGRLRKALERQDHRSIRSFAFALEETGVRGHTYSSVYDYVVGKVQPRPEWIATAAKILGVRAEWLASGEGEMTQIDQELTDNEALWESIEEEKEEWESLDRGQEVYEVFTSNLRTFISAHIDDEYSPFLSLPTEIRSCLRQFLFRYYRSLYTSRATVGTKPPDGDLPARLSIDPEKLEPDFTEIREFVRANFGQALAIRPQGSGEFGSAILAQLSVLYLRYFGLSGEFSKEEDHES
jgi:hypothetical protein